MLDVGCGVKGSCPTDQRPHLTKDPDLPGIQGEMQIHRANIPNKLFGAKFRNSSKWKIRVHENLAWQRLTWCVVSRYDGEGST